MVQVAKVILGSLKIMVQVAVLVNRACSDGCGRRWSHPCSGGASTSTWKGLIPLPSSSSSSFPLSPPSSLPSMKFLGVGGLSPPAPTLAPPLHPWCTRLCTWHLPFLPFPCKATVDPSMHACKQCKFWPSTILWNIYIIRRVQWHALGLFLRSFVRCRLPPFEAFGRRGRHRHAVARQHFLARVSVLSTSLAAKISLRGFGATCPLNRCSLTPGKGFYHRA